MSETDVSMRAAILVQQSPRLPADDSPEAISAALRLVCDDFVHGLGGAHKAENAAAVLRAVVATWPEAMRPGDVLILAEADRVARETREAAAALAEESAGLTEEAALLGLGLREPRLAPAAVADVETALHALAVELVKRGGSRRATEACAILDSAVMAWPEPLRPSAAARAKAAGWVVQQTIAKTAPPPAPEPAPAGEAEKPAKGKKKGGSKRPPPPDLPTEAPGEDGSQPWDGLDTEKLKDSWRVTPLGVVPMRWDGRVGAMSADINKRLCNLPIWPARLGRDVATGRGFVELGWRTPDHAVRHAWLPEDDVRSGAKLLELPGGPIAGANFLRAAVYLTEACVAIRNPAAEVTSHLGWCGIDGARRWVWPGTGEAAQARFIGDALPGHGSIEDWTVGLKRVLALGEKGYTALVCAAFSAAAPWARLLNGQRNPVVGLMARSSSGKGSVLAWALALWADPQSLTLPASSTGKGLQDRAIQYPDLPIFLDEIQQLVELHPIVASDAIYFIANGQRRVTSSKAQTSVGGEVRHGVGFYAAEAPVLPGLNAGVQLRVVELTGDPCPDAETARILRQASQACGVAAEAISKAVQAQSVGEWLDQLRAISEDARRQHAGLEAGDGDVVALLCRGCDLLGQLTGEDLPTESVAAWFAGRIAGQRRERVDRETACLRSVLDWLCNLDWIQENTPTGGGPPTLIYRTEIALQQHLVAWSAWSPPGPGGRRRTGLECDPTQRDLATLFDRFGGERRILPAWADRGWIERQGAHCKVRKWGGGRVVRFTAQALAEHLSEPAEAVP